MNQVEIKIEYLKRSLHDNSTLAVKFWQIKDYESARLLFCVAWHAALELEQLKTIEAY